MESLNLNIELRNEVSGVVGNAGILLAGSLMRIRATDEFSILKLDSIIRELQATQTVKLADAADIQFFKNCLLGCDAFHIVKSTVLRQLNELKK